MLSQKINKLVVAAIISSISASASAAYTCSGPVKGVSLDMRSGDLLLESLGTVSWARICNFHTAASSIQPDDCKRLYAALLMAQGGSKGATVWIEDPSTTCTTLTPWAFVNGLYFVRIDN